MIIFINLISIVQFDGHELLIYHKTMFNIYVYCIIKRRKISKKL